VQTTSDYREVNPLKLRRQQLILEIVNERQIMTQEELAEALRERGIIATQATISRDIKEMQLVKTPVGSDSYRYAKPQGGQPDLARIQERLRRLFQEAVVKYDFSGNLVVIHTLPGAAQGVASALDQSGWPEIIGTVAGDDAILVVVKPVEDVPRLTKKIEFLLK
jgi:transcriptional regulator of arginine metabolism